MGFVYVERQRPRWKLNQNGRRRQGSEWDLYPRIGCPGGTSDNSPAFQRRVGERKNSRPRGTLEPRANTCVITGCRVAGPN